MCRNIKIFVSVLAIALVVVFVAQAAISTPNMQNSVVVDGTDPESPYASWQSNRYTHIQNTAINTFSHDLVGYNMVAENDNLALYIREDDVSMRVVNKKNGYVWGALTEEQSSKLNDTWKSFANSIVGIEYVNTGSNYQRVGAGDASSKCTFEYSNNKVKLNINFNVCGVSLTAFVELKDDHIQFSVDEKSIKETSSEFYLANLYFVPFLGATHGDEVPGYSFVPDGSGALINFEKPSSYLKPFSNRVYGLDYAIDNLLIANGLESTRPNDFAKDEYTVSMPVFGMVHGSEQNAVFARIENGAEYAIIHSSPAGCDNLDFNWTSANFIYHQSYQQKTTKSGAGIQVVQKQRNKVNPKISYYFLNDADADYVGMAKLYKKLLSEDDMLPKKLGDTSTLAIDFIIEDLEKGFFANKVKEISSVEYIEDAMETLGEKGIDDIHLTLLGWQKKGLHGYSASKTFSKTNFGSFSELDELKDILSKGDVSLYVDYLRAREPQLKESKDAAISLSQLPVFTKRDDELAFLGTTYYLKSPDSLTRLKEQSDILKENGMGNPVIDGGQFLYGEYLQDNFAPRSNVRDFAEKIFGAISKKDKLTVFKPNDYLFAYTKEYRDIPMNSSQYIFEDDTVPFLQIALSGKVAMFAPYANDSFYSKSNVLKCIEYNCYPSFLLTEETNYDISETALTDYSSTQFEDWDETIVEIYNEINGILSNVKGQEVVNHSAVDNGVMVISYESGDILVNYRSTDYTYQGVTVPALSAMYQDNGKVG